jgi:hypothetical protein
MSLSPQLTRSEPAAVLAAVKDAARRTQTRRLGVIRPGRKNAAQPNRKTSVDKQERSLPPTPNSEEAKNINWVEPRLLCQIEFRDWTHDGLLRLASFKGLREDKSADQIILVMPPKFSRPRVELDRAAVNLTHPERILWVDPGITKQRLADFYIDVANWILPHIGGRVLSLVRCRSGTNEKCFFAKHP